MVSSSSRRFTRTLIVPSVRRICAVRSSRLRKEKPVSLPSRTAVEPKRNSARPSLSVQSLSPVVIGRLATIVTQSSVPAGSNETGPPVKLKRAAREGGSSESRSCAIANFGKKKVAAKSVAKRASHLVVLVPICISPEACEVGAGFIVSRKAFSVPFKLAPSSAACPPGHLPVSKIELVPWDMRASLYETPGWTKSCRKRRPCLLLEGALSCTVAAGQFIPFGKFLNHASQPTQ